jgi:cell division septation protein DedD
VVQVATVQRRADANAEAKALKAKGYDPFVSPAPKGKSGFRVRVGKFKSYNEAVAAKQRLQKIAKYRDAWVPPT